MTIEEKVIQESVERYERERDRYLKLAARVADIARTEIVEENTIRAQVTSRVKSVRSFEGKLRRFAKRDDVDLSTVGKIFDKIGDLAGVRVATYQAEDEERVVKDIVKRFRGLQDEAIGVDKKDKLVHGSFYRATHCQVYLRSDDLVGTYENLKGTTCEIQVCSMMAHVWNEIEHDIAYKPDGDGPQEAERGLLNALGYLTRSGDAVISRLLEANLGRLRELTGDFEDAFDFVARLRDDFPEADLTINAGELFREVQSLGLTSPEKLKQAIGEGNYRAEIGKAKLVDFNAYLTSKGDDDYLLDEVSSDVILILLLEKFAARIETNHPAGRGQGRPPRIRSVATRYRKYKKG
jgi:ppGpp synthetase/RelA/SpoT-type nucleotidyltranferase